MARKKLTEFRAKTLIAAQTNTPYYGLSITPTTPEEAIHALPDGQTYVVKVDQGIKKRMKQGLVLLRVSKQDIPRALQTLREKGYTGLLIEPYVAHEPQEERYVSFARVREGLSVLYTRQGGIDIESHSEMIHALMMHETKELSPVSETLQVPLSFLEGLCEAFEANAMTFLEINPLILHEGSPLPLDIACEVDDGAELLVHHHWSADDFPQAQTKTEEEQHIDLLKQKSAASFSFVPLNLNGSIFMLLSGGGVSIVLADEVYNLGFGKELANYGEYSGNPNAEETYVYTKNVLSLLLKSQAPKKVLLIGGGVANFTDIAKTFTGVIRALEEVKDMLREQGVKVFVRRGGPNQAEGLARMKDFLEKEHLYGNVCGPETPLPQIVQEMVHSI